MGNAKNVIYEREKPSQENSIISRIHYITLITLLVFHTF